MASEFARPGEYDRFITEVCGELEAAGLSGAAERLARIQTMTFTTSSELLLELGETVLAIRHEHAVPRALNKRLDRLMREVRRAWPTYGYQTQLRWSLLLLWIALMWFLLTR